MANKLSWNPPKWKSYTLADSVDDVLKELFECQATIEKFNIGIKRANDIREYFDAEVE